MNVVDNAIALRILYLLIKPFDQWPAYRQGIIDSKGNILKPGVKSNDWSMLHRLVLRIKVLLGKLPGGESKIASVLAGYMLVRENINIRKDSDFSYLTEEDILNQKFTFKDYSSFVKLLEDGEAIGSTVPANNTNNAAGLKGEPPVNLKKRKKNVGRYFRRLQSTTGR